ncbi:ATP-binding cassette domain-containing protein [Limibaculum sp. FT325]|uniref:branched-chain amino acid ABC transporter ATP-binding protein/permease n=1 Tax=Thermohalobaculum sediminis TaxID=2939436 RepID=UPI0020BEBDE8|nr:ATP-binding cassette domain-containing protein [Limibaculum sediminis]MCL5777193.1 ATP-binding cassette domain-containing protein [Limibaculum sediminis]
MRQSGSASQLPLTLGIVALTAAGAAFAWTVGGYFSFVAALVALTTVVGVGLNVLVGLTGQISLGHVGFYALGAYAVAILTLAGLDYWVAFVLAGLITGCVGGLLALPALRVSGPYLAMVTIAFGFIVEHGTIEARGLTGGQNGLMGFAGPHLGGADFDDRQIAIFAILLAGAALVLFQRLLYSGWGRAMLAVRDSETAARSTALSPILVKTSAFALSAALTGLAGAVFAPLMMFIAPSSFMFSQSILFLFAVMVGGVGWTLGPLAGAIVTVLLPELLADLAEYRLLFFSVTLILVLWLAPSGIVGALARVLRREARALPPVPAPAEAVAFIERARDGLSLVADRIGISFGGIRAADEVSFEAPPGRITSIIGPNGAGKTTVLNMIGAFYRPSQGSIRLGQDELAGRTPTDVSRAGIARTYQTTRLFETLSVLDNILIGLRRGRLGNPTARLGSAEEARLASALLHFVGYRGSVMALAGDLPHVDRRLVEIARALALRPRVLLLDEPAAGLAESEKKELAALVRIIADHGLAVVLVEHDMGMVMGISDHIVVLDAGRPIAAGTPDAVRTNPAVIEAYLGAGEMQARPRAGAWAASGEPVLEVADLAAGYSAAPVLKRIGLSVARGEMVGILGANGAGKSTTMRAIVGLLRPVEGRIALGGAEIQREAAHQIARRGVALVPEGRQVFPELTVLDNILIGACRRGAGDYSAEVARLLERFPRLKDRIGSRAGLLSGGEQQMLAVARGLMAKPEVLLLDEPSLGLAPAMIEELFAVLADLRDEGTTILIVDQMAKMTLGVADRAYVLEQGRVVRAGPAAELAEDASLEEAYLGGAAQDDGATPRAAAR